MTRQAEKSDRRHQSCPTNSAMSTSRPPQSLEGEASPRCHTPRDKADGCRTHSVPRRGQGRTAHWGMRGTTRSRCPTDMPSLKGHRRLPRPQEVHHRSQQEPEAAASATGATARHRSAPRGWADPPLGDAGSTPPQHHCMPPTPPTGPPRPHAIDPARGKLDPAALTPSPTPRRHRRRGRRGRGTPLRRSGEELPLGERPCRPVLRAREGPSRPLRWRKEEEVEGGGARRPGVGRRPSLPAWGQPDHFYI